MKHSIRYRMVAIFVGVLALTLILYVVINNFFLESFYYMKKQQNFKNAYDTIDLILDSEQSEEQLNSELTRMRDTENITFLMVNSGWGLDSVSENCTSPFEANELKNRLMNYMILGNSIETQEIQILEQTSVYTIQKALYNRMGTEYLECYGMLDNNMFIMSTPLEAIRDSAEIANQFLLIIGVILMLLSTILISAVSRSITEPILSLADLSTHMARLDFTHHYEGKAKDEIGILGNSMNLLCGQLKETIEELQSANEQLKKDIEEKVQIDELRKEFLSNVSHELKTPIALIQGYAEGLQEGINEDPESQQFYCEVITDEANKMSHMVKKLLTLNHLEFGQDVVSLEPFDLTELLDSALNAMERLKGNEPMKLVRNYQGPCVVFGDEFQIEEVCTNYISNAIHHLAGERVITVSVVRIMDQIKVLVHNTGEKIPEESLNKVWIKFYKVDKARTREYGGSGIGLSIVKAIMDAHHQPYGVYNEDDGVTFWFCLKRYEDAPEPEKEREETEDVG